MSSENNAKIVFENSPIELGLYEVSIALAANSCLVMSNHDGLHGWYKQYQELLAVAERIRISDSSDDLSDLDDNGFPAHIKPYNRKNDTLLCDILHDIESMAFTIRHEFEKLIIKNSAVARASFSAGYNAAMDEIDRSIK